MVHKKIEANALKKTYWRKRRRLEFDATDASGTSW